MVTARAPIMITAHLQVPLQWPSIVSGGSGPLGPPAPATHPPNRGRGMSRPLQQMAGNHVPGLVLIPSNAVRHAKKPKRVAHAGQAGILAPRLRMVIAATPTMTPMAIGASQKLHATEVTGIIAEPNAWSTLQFTLVINRCFKTSKPPLLCI